MLSMSLYFTKCTIMLHTNQGCTVTHVPARLQDAFVSSAKLINWTTQSKDPIERVFHLPSKPCISLPQTSAYKDFYLFFMFYFLQLMAPVVANHHGS